MNKELHDYLNSILIGRQILDFDLQTQPLIDTPEGRKQVAGIILEHKFAEGKIQHELLLIQQLEQLNAEAARLYEYWGEDTQDSREYKRITAEIKKKEAEIKRLKNKKVNIDEEQYSRLLDKEIKRLEIESEYEKAVRKAKLRAIEQKEKKVSNESIKRGFYETINAAEIRRTIATMKMENDESYNTAIDNQEMIR